MESSIAIEIIESICCIDEKDCLGVFIIEHRSHGMDSSFTACVLASADLKGTNSRKDIHFSDFKYGLTHNAMDGFADADWTYSRVFVGWN